jgi:hypothetical protein
MVDDFHKRTRPQARTRRLLSLYVRGNGEKFTGECDFASKARRRAPIDLRCKVDPTRVAAAGSVPDAQGPKSTPGSAQIGGRAERRRRQGIDR